ncbi:hypothetical protein [Chryseobacterium phocaeense]|uniref:hypothetical protein n=1 Tax=Chryseobacterium phocaeense TaxID=1816690 RepID=UPI001E59B3BE|nr:hypothetical protein [Chryseobacterium phocaeense]
MIINYSTRPINGYPLVDEIFWFVLIIQFKRVKLNGLLRAINGIVAMYSAIVSCHNN